MRFQHGVDDRPTRSPSSATESEASSCRTVRILRSMAASRRGVSSTVGARSASDIRNILLYGGNISSPYRKIFSLQVQIPEYLLDCVHGGGFGQKLFHFNALRRTKGTAVPGAF